MSCERLTTFMGVVIDTILFIIIATIKCPFSCVDAVIETQSNNKSAKLFDPFLPNRVGAWVVRISVLVLVTVWFWLGMRRSISLGAGLRERSVWGKLGVEAVDS